MEEQQAQGARGVNPNSFCTRWVERSDEEHAAALARYEAGKRRAWYLRTHPAVARAEARKRQRAPLAMRVDNRPFSVWAAPEA